MKISAQITFKTEHIFEDIINIIYDIEYSTNMY